MTTETGTVPPEQVLADPDLLNALQSAVIQFKAIEKEKADARPNIAVRAARRVRKVAYDARNAVFRFVNWLTRKYTKFMAKHPVLRSVVEFMAAFTIGFAIGVLMYVVCVLMLVGVFILLGV